MRKLNKAAGDVIDTPNVKRRLADVGVSITPADRRSPAYLASFIPAEIKKWEGPIKASGVVGE